MLPPVKSVPDGFHTITPHLYVKGAAQAIEFYKAAFGADELARLDGPGGTIAHAEIAIGDSVVMVKDEIPEIGITAPTSIGGTSVAIHLYVDDADAWFARATDAGAQTLKPMADMFWGDRYGMVADPFGHRWAIATHVNDLSLDEIAERHAAAFAKPAS